MILNDDYNAVVITEENYLEHYGILRRSGRYPWGSGGPEHASNESFLGYVEQLRKQGMTEVEIAKAFGVTTTQLRAAKSIAKNEQRQSNIDQAQRLKENGYSNIAIAKRMGLPNESSVRALLAPGVKDRADVLQTTANMLREQVEEKRFIDIGSGVENHLGISKTKLSTAVAVLKEEGYKVHYLKERQLGTGKETTFIVLSKPDVPWSEINNNKNLISQITDYSEDGGRSFLRIQPPISINSKRIGVRYKEEGGAEADGVIYVRPGVHDLTLGKSRYAQVRVAVDGTHYLKGMAMYKDDLPPGVDLVFNTNKSNTGNKLDAMKELKNDPDLPFGSIVRQLPKLDAHGKAIPDTVRSAMNIVNEEGDWEKWSRNLSSQFLSKQSPGLAKQQLDMAYEHKKSEFDEIMSLTNPTVKKKLLESFSDDADSSAVHLKAHILPGTANHVILPINSMKETEVYAPNYENGTRVALVRYPHGGTFEIPELTVNNRHREAKSLLGDAPDAIGIHSKVAERLSGADFDGDTVLVIPNRQGRVKSTPALQELKNFDPKASFPAYEGMPRMTARQKGMLMGDVSNLITDMTIKGANTHELARAVRHSMVVIDAEKHHLDYKESARVNGIADLKKRYQNGARSGASTLISRKKRSERVPEQKQGYRIDPATGKRIFTETGNSFVGRDGHVVIKKTKVNILDRTDNAHDLSSGTKVEKIYADHSNRLKALANEARRNVIATHNQVYSPSANVHYADQVATLNAKLNLALKNAPLERQAQLIGNTIVRAKQDANPDLAPEELKKIKNTALIEARRRTGAGKQRIDITDTEWEAIQAGAISPTRLKTILQHSDLDRVKELATPRTRTVMTPIKMARAKSMLASGFTQAEVASQLGVPVSTLRSSLGGE